MRAAFLFSVIGYVQLAITLQVQKEDIMAEAQPLEPSDDPATDGALHSNLLVL
jgi:hypothetical protein